MKTYRVAVDFLIKGEVTVTADNVEEAQEIVRNNVGGRFHGNVDPTCADIVDWDIEMCPETIPMGGEVLQ